MRAKGGDGDGIFCCGGGVVEERRSGVIKFYADFGLGL